MKLNRTGSNWNRLERNKINENWDIIEGSYNDVVGQITDEVVGHLIDSAKLIWKEPVDTVDDLPTNAEVGETRMVREADPDGISYVYRYDGEKWEKIQAIDVTLVNEVDRRLTAQLADTGKEIALNRNNPAIKNGAIVFDIDDGKKEDYTVAYPFLESLGIPATICIPPERIGWPDRLTWGQVRELVDAGWSVGSHTINEVQLGDITDETEIDRQCRESKKMIEAQGFKCDYLSYPNGSYNDTVQRIAKRYYKAASTIDSGVNPRVLRSQMLNRVSLRFVETNYILDMIDVASAQNRLLLFYVHGIEFDEAMKQKITTIVDYARSKQVEFMNFDDAWKEYGNFIDLGLYGVDENNYVVSFRGDSVINNNRIIERIYKSSPPSQHGITANTPITSFRKDAATYTQIDQARANGFPENKPGTIVTNYMIEWDGYSWQEYHINRENKIYRRYWDNGWKPFELIVNGNIVEGTRTVGNWTGVQVNLTTHQIQPNVNYTVLFAPTWDAGSIWATNITETGFFVNWEKNPPGNTLLGFKIIRAHN